ncbi:MAG: hypothetical protein HQK72_17460 [Desulfamplus sp.]|nr:hypothetical protein [Desulfamplus sp.]
MQLFTDYTQEDLNSNIDPLFLLCHPLSKLKLVSDLLISFDRGDKTRAFDGFDSSAAFTVGDMISDAVREIEAVQKAAYHQYSKLKQESDRAFTEKLQGLIPAYDLAQHLEKITKKAKEG